MSRQDLEELLSAYLDDELSAEDRELVERALEASPRLQALREQWQAAGQLLRELPAQQLGPEFMGRVHQRIDQAGRVAPAARRRGVRWVAWLGLGFAVAAAIGIMAWRLAPERQRVAIRRDRATPVAPTPPSGSSTPTGAAGPPASEPVTPGREAQVHARSTAPATGEVPAQRGAALRSSRAGEVPAQAIDRDADGYMDRLKEAQGPALRQAIRDHGRKAGTPGGDDRAGLPAFARLEPQSGKATEEKLKEEEATARPPAAQPAAPTTREKYCYIHVQSKLAQEPARLVRVARDVMHQSDPTVSPEPIQLGRAALDGTRPRTAGARPVLVLSYDGFPQAIEQIEDRLRQTRGILQVQSTPPPSLEHFEVRKRLGAADQPGSPRGRLTISKDLGGAEGGSIGVRPSAVSAVPPGEPKRPQSEAGARGPDALLPVPAKPEGRPLARRSLDRAGREPRLGTLAGAAPRMTRIPTNDEGAQGQQAPPQARGMAGQAGATFQFRLGQGATDQGPTPAAAKAKERRAVTVFFVFYGTDQPAEASEKAIPPPPAAATPGFAQ